MTASCCKMMGEREIRKRARGQTTRGKTVARVAREVRTSNVGEERECVCSKHEHQPLFIHSFLHFSFSLSLPHLPHRIQRSNCRPASTADRVAANPLFFSFLNPLLLFFIVIHFYSYFHFFTHLFPSFSIFFHFFRQLSSFSSFFIGFHIFSSLFIFSFFHPSILLSLQCGKNAL